MESGEGGGPTVTDQDIANIVAQWTGIPIEKVGCGQGGASKASRKRLLRRSWCKPTP